MDRKLLTRILLVILGVLATVGIVPAWLGLASNVVLDELDKVPVSEKTFDYYSAEVVRVIDGDTIEVKMLEPPEALEVLRLIGVDTPETVHPRMPVQFFGPEATEFTKSQCIGNVVRLHLQKKGPRRGSYGRLLVYVLLPGGSILNEEIIKTGHGYSYTKYPHEFTDKYNALEVEARVLKRGLWATVKFEDLPPWLRESRPGVLDK